MHAIKPYLSRAMRLAIKVGLAADKAAGAVLEIVGTHALALDARGHVLWTTSDALVFIAPELAVRAGKLVALDGGLSRTLNGRLDIALSAASPSRHPKGSSLLVRRETGDHYLVEIVTLPRSAYDVFSKAVVLVFFRRIGPSADIDPDVLARLFDLTPAEARVAARVGIGDSAVVAARRLGLGYETVRTHLANIYAKMSISGQSQLAQIVQAVGPA